MIDKIIDVLMDGKYHTVYDLVEKTNIPMRNIGMMLMALHEGDFVTFCRGYASRVKLDIRVQKFWRKIKWIERTGA